MKKRTSILILICVMAMMMFASANIFAAEPFVGSGTEKDPYLITNYEDLCKLAELANTETEPYLSAHYLQTADIVANEGTFTLSETKEPLWNGKIIDDTNAPVEWTAIRTFRGFYNGGNYNIIGLYQKSYGIFHTIVNAQIINLTVKESLFSASGGGVICKYAYNGLIENCHNIDNIILNEKITNPLGGICGVADISADYGLMNEDLLKGTLFHNCTNTSDLSGSDTIGGICAELHGSIIYCANYGTIQGYESADNVGGIAGYAIPTDEYWAISYCGNYGDISNTAKFSSHYNTAGICGQIENGYNIENCANLGNITTKTPKDSNTSGICGESIPGEEYANAIFCCGNYGDVSNVSSQEYISKQAAGICAESKDVTYISYCFNRGDISGNGCTGGITANTKGNGNFHATYFSKIRYCYNTGKVTGKDPVNTSSSTSIGSVSGSTFADMTDDCYYLIGTSEKGIGYNGGGPGKAFAMTEEEMKDPAFLRKLNIDGTYFKYDDLNENDGYPILLSHSIMPFADVPKDAYYFDNVVWAVENGITYGVDNAHFGPDQNCTRAQFITFLWRAAGEPEATITQTPFTDCSANQYYYPALLWAYENDLVAGMTETTFDPNGKITRAQVVTFLWRDAGSEIIETTSPFTDVPADAWYADAVTWAYSTKLASGMTETTFGPEIFSTRAHVVAFLHRYAKAETE